MAGVGVTVASVLLAGIGLLFVRLRWRPVGMLLFVPKMVAQALSPLIGVTAAMLAVVGGLAGWWWTAGIAGAAAAAAVIVVLRIGTVDVDLSQIVGVAGRGAPPPSHDRAGLIDTGWRGPLPRPPAPRLRQDVAFATVPDSDRTLRCDVWRPPDGVASSGVGVVYLHSSAWTVFDKDAGTRPLFAHLAARGHVVVDVAHRLFPETGIPGMVADAGRAIAWLKAHADEFGVDRDRIVLAGGSAGGHLALLTAYANGDPTLAPHGYAPGDVAVAAVAALYAPADLAAQYDHTDQATSCRPDDPQPDWDAPTPAWMVRVFGRDAARYRMQLMPVAGRFDWLLGGTPDQVPERYERLSPLHRVHPGCPPTLLVHGEHDQMAPVASTRQLHQRLRDAGVPVAAVYVPHTDHAFDLIAPRWAPPARLAIHTLQRFLDGVASSTSWSALRGSASESGAGAGDQDHVPGATSRSWRQP